MERQRDSQADPRRERGASAVEFAIILPVLLLFLYGIIQFGMMFLIQHGLTEAASDAARSAATAPQANAVSIATAQVNNDIHGDAGFIPSADNCSMTNSNAVLYCHVWTAPCPNQPAGYTCLTVQLTYNRGSDPNGIMPDFLNLKPTMTATSTILLSGSLSS